MDDYIFYNHILSDLRYEQRNTDYADDYYQRRDIKIQLILFQILRTKCPDTLTSTESRDLKYYVNKYQAYVDMLGEVALNCTCVKHKTNSTRLNFGRSRKSHIMFHSILDQIVENIQRRNCPRYQDNKWANTTRTNHYQYEYNDSEEDNFEDFVDHQRYAAAYTTGRTSYDPRVNYSSDEDYSDYASESDCETEDVDQESDHDSSTCDQRHKNSSSTLKEIQDLINNILHKEYPMIPLPWKDIYCEAIPLPWISEISRQPEIENDYFNSKVFDTKGDDHKSCVRALPVGQPATPIDGQVNINNNGCTTSLIDYTYNEEQEKYVNYIGHFSDKSICRAMMTRALNLDKFIKVIFKRCLRMIIGNRRRDVMWWNTRFKFLVATL